MELDSKLPVTFVPAHEAIISLFIILLYFISVY